VRVLSRTGLAAKPSLPYPSLPKGERGKKNLAIPSFSLLSLWERRGRGGEGFCG